jgi:hypothetical protein
MLGFGTVGEFALGQIDRHSRWSESNEDGETWTSVTAQSETWTEVTKQTETWTEA